jgi:hypothetical protein
LICIGRYAENEEEDSEAVRDDEELKDIATWILLIGMVPQHENNR